MDFRKIFNILLLSGLFLGGIIHAEPIEILRHGEEFSTAQLKAAQMDGQPVIVVEFQGTEDLHYYADPTTAPAPELTLTAEVSAEGVTFSDTLYPEPEMFYDASLNKEVEVFSGNFNLLLSIESFEKSFQVVKVNLSGIACTSKLCLPPFQKTVTREFNFSQTGSWPEADFTPAKEDKVAEKSTSPDQIQQPVASLYEATAMLLLAVLAGLSFNIMPCVLPVLPLVASRMLNIAKENTGRRVALGLTFCLGIVVFFTAVGIFSSAVRLTTGTVFNLSDPYRYVTFDIVMVVFLVIFAMFMFDVLPLTLPSRVSNKSADTSSFTGSLGMGFLAAILSIPCSGAILAAVLIWVQAQHWLMGFWVFVLMGVGMALPYGGLVLVPSLLNRIPKPGHWMEYFKKAVGFAMLLLAIKPLSALPKDRIIDVATFAVIIAFSAWMWGTWVSYSASTIRKWMVRGLAGAVVIVSGLWLLPQKTAIIDWVDYDRGVIQAAVADNRPVLIKFTADWCTNCKILESRVFHDKTVADFIQNNNILPIRADTTLAEYDAARDLQQIYSIPGTVPMTILLLPDLSDEPVRLSGIYSKQDLFDVFQSLD